MFCSRLFLSAYDILSNEEKRKNYDFYGDDKGNPGFNAGHPRDRGWYTYFRSGGPGKSGFTSRPGERQNMGGQGVPKHSHFPLVVPVEGIHLVLAWMIYSTTFWGVVSRVGVNSVVLVVLLVLNLNLGIPLRASEP